MCTGGFGDHFNTTDKPHHYYSMKYLVEKGIPEAAFLDAPLSSNTIEDFQLIKDLVITENPDVLTVITSDFHMKRAQILCNRIINYAKVIFIPAPSSLSKEELVPLIEHETSAIKRLAYSRVKEFGRVLISEIFIERKIDETGIALTEFSWRYMFVMVSQNAIP